MRSIKKGSECGVILHDFSDLQPDDRLELYEMVERRPGLYDEEAGGG